MHPCNEWNFKKTHLIISDQQNTNFPTTKDQKTCIYGNVFDNVKK